MTNALLTRLTAAAKATRDREAAATDARELRDRLIVEAIDVGCSQQTVAGAAGVSRARVNAVLACSQPEPAPAAEPIPHDATPAAAA
jgi:hypothetical protein